MRLRFLTLNVWGLMWPVGRDVDARMRAIGDRLPDLEIDVAAFQEVWTEEARAVLLESGRRAGLSHVWHNPETRQGSGLLVLSRLPISRRRFDAFALRGFAHRIDHGDYHGRKGFALVTVATDAGPVCVLDTHLHAQYRSREDDAYLTHRTGQVVELALAVREVRDPVVALGDFNLKEGLEEYRVLRGLSGLRDAAPLLDRREMTVLAENAYRRGRDGGEERIDYAFVRDGAQASATPLAIRRVFDEMIEIDGREAAYSDHAGLLVDVAIERGRGAPVPPLDPAAIELAGSTLAAGRRDAEARRSRDRFVGAGLAFGGLAAAASARNTRRRALRALAFGAGALALGSSGLAFLLSEGIAPDELRAYDDVMARLRAAAADEGA